MIKKEKNNQNYYKDNNNKKFDKNKSSNIKKNSPVLSHQENNYFYNTKINHLILQGLSNVNRDQNIYEQPHTSVYINYDISDKNQNNNTLPPKSYERSIYKKTASLENMNTMIGMQKNIKERECNNSTNKDNKNLIGINFLSNRKGDSYNIYSKSFLEESSNKNDNNKSNKNNNSNNSNNINKNNYNPFQVLNYLKKRKNASNNIFDIVNKELNIEIKNNEKEKETKLSKSGFFKNSNNTYINGTIHKNNNYFYNIQNSNYNKSNKNINPMNFNNKINNDNNNILHNNKSTGCRKIPLKNDKIGNYNIKSPGNFNSRKNIKYNKNSRININNKKNGCKSPEIKGKNSFIGLIMSKNNCLNKFSNVYNSEIGFYKKNNENITKSTVVVNNIIQRRNILNTTIKKNSNVNSINRNNNFNSLQNLNNIYTNNCVTPNDLSDNTFIDNEKKLNTQNDIYIKINPKNYRLVEVGKQNNSGYHSPKINNNYTEKKMKDITNFKNNKKSKKVDYNKIKNSIEQFADILEQFYYNSFKNCYIFFIKQLDSYIKDKNSKRSVILRRLKSVQKPKDIISNTNINKNSSMANINNTNNIKNNKEINDPRKKEKSPSKFVELQNSLMPSMMNINQDNYIEMFNELFKKQNESYDDKRCRSPIIDKRTLKKDINLLKDSLDFGNNRVDKMFSKYKTNTNVTSLYFSQRANIQLNNDLDNNKEQDSRQYDTTNQKISFRDSISIDKKNNFLNKSTNDKTKKYIYNDISNNNNTEQNNENSTNNDNMIFQSQKYKISNSPEPYFYSNNKNIIENKDKMGNRKKGQSQIGKNIMLYSKPLLKKSITKESENMSNNINLINIKKNEKNNNMSKTKINTSLNNNIITVNRNLSKTPNYNNNQKSIFENLNYKEKKNKCINKFSEIIIKNVSTKDKRLHVFIKYIDSGITNKKRNKYKRKLFYETTDSITFYGNKKHSFVFIKSVNNEFDFDNINIENNRVYHYTSSRITNNNNRYENEKEDKKNEGKYKNSRILTKIREEEKSNKKLNNSNSINDEQSINVNNNKSNDDINNSIIYLINYLQNMYNDNKKMILFTFFKNLKKIKTNALLHTSIKTKGKYNKSKNVVNNAQRNNEKNIIELNNKNYKNLSNHKNSSDIFVKTNLKYDSLKSSATRNKRNNNLDYAVNKSNLIDMKKPILDDDIFQTNYKKNKKNNNNHYYNTSFNKSNVNIYNSISNSIYKEDNNITNHNIILDDIKKLKEEEINTNEKEKENEEKRDEYKNSSKNKKTKKSNKKYEKNKIRKKSKKNKNSEKKEKKENKEKNDNNDNEDKEKLKKMKLAKLGKLFKNLEQENNIITAIKEQFLEWSNNNNLDLRKSNIKRTEEENDKYDRNKKYDIKTFDMKYMFNNNNEYIENDNKKINKKDFQDIINKFKIRLINFSLKYENKKRIQNNSEYEEEEEDEEECEEEEEKNNFEKDKSYENKRKTKSKSKNKHQK